MPYDAPGAVLSLHGDTSFDPVERQYVQEACDQWAKITHGYIQMHVTWDLDFNDESSLVGHVGDDVLLRAGQDFEDEWQEATDNHDAILLGLTVSEHNQWGMHIGTRIYLVTPYLSPHRMFVHVAMHEFGHAIGLKHVQSSDALMAAAEPDDPPNCLHRSDAKELCRVYGCDPERIGYCSPD